MGFIKQVALIVGLSVVAATISAFVHPKRPPWYRVSSTEELRWQITVEEVEALPEKSEILWIDAREREKYDEGHLPGALLLNLGEWSELMFANLDALQSAFERPVVVYCDSDSCGKSREVGKRLRETIGLDPVYILKGDWRDLAE